MATCDPKTLSAQAACFNCLTTGQKKEVNLYLLAVISGLNTPAALRQAGKNFRMFKGKEYLAAKTYLLDLLDGSFSASQAAALSDCWHCIPKANRAAVETYLLASATAFGTNPQTLVGPAAVFRPLLENYEEVELGALAAITGTSAAQVGQNLSCFLCLEHCRLVEVDLFLECLGFGTNIVPPGSVYTGSPPEFDLTVLANTSYHITWGANDLYVIICGSRYDSAGMGTSINVQTGSCTLMQFFGTFAGTSVTVNVTPVHNVKVIPNLFTWNPISSTQAQATWGSPVTGVVSTEVWTSTDGVTFALAGTVAAPGTTLTLTGPAVSTILYAKARWIYTDGGNGGFTKILSAYGNVSDWAARVITNGGAAVSAATLAAVNTFYDKIFLAGTIIGKVKAMNIVAPDNLTAARTPLIKGVGSDPWPAIGSLAVNVNGIIATAATSCLQTGVVPSTAFAAITDSGLTSYAVTTTNADSAATDFGSSQAAGQVCQQFNNFLTGGNQWAIFQAYNNSTGSIGFHPSTGTGFFSGNQTAGTQAVYYGSSATGFITEITTVQNGGLRPTIQIYAMGLNNSGVTSGTTQIRRYSFFCVHSGFTSTEAQALYNAVQALRVAFGGGFV